MASQDNNFTNQARLVLQNSQELVRRHRHNQWDVEHVLLALLELEDGVPTRILAELGHRLRKSMPLCNRAWEMPPNWPTKLPRFTRPHGPSA